MLYTIIIGKRQEKGQVQRLKIGLALMLTMSIILMSRPTAVLCSVMPAELNDLMENGVANKHDVENFGHVDKRKSWQALHSSWGKRTFVWKELPASHNPTNDVVNSDDNEPEAWLHLTMPVNKNDRKNRDKISLIYLSNDKTQNDNPQTSALRDNDTTEDETESDDELLSQKRTAGNVNAAWSKRRNAPAWKIFQGAFGKREPGWNNLKGMWGKRSIKQWQKLHSGWGKRDQAINYDDNNNNNINNSNNK